MQLPSRYAATGEVINGGCGSITLCSDTHLDRPVAIKSIHGDQDISRLMDELSALMLMRSKHVVQIYDIIHNNGAPVGIVEEYISGDDLMKSAVPQSSLENYLQILWQIAAGISDIHSTGIIHRDIKPNNMMLDSESVLKIFDFGLARNVGPNAETRGFKGTFYFAAPELFSTETVAFSQAIDVYAFGATACYLADKNIPRELGQAPPQPAPANTFTSKPYNIPEELKSLFLSCLSHNPENRPPLSTIRDAIARHLLKDKHQAITVYQNTPKYLNANNRNITLKFGTIGTVEIEYDGFRFFIKSVSGEVSINNRDVAVNEEIPGSCVVALGSNRRHSAERAYITFDISHPEVVL